MNIINDFKLLNEKIHTSNKNLKKYKDSNQSFLETFNKEKNNSTFQDKSSKKIDKTSYITKSNKKQLKSIELSNSSSHHKSQVSHKDTDKFHLKEFKQLNDYEENKDDTEKLKDLPLDPIILLLQNLLSTPADNNKMDELKLDLSSVKIEDLCNLKEQLNILLNTADTKGAYLIKENINKAITLLNEIIDQPANNNEILLKDEDVADLINNIKNIKDHLESNFKKTDTKIENNLKDEKDENKYKKEELNSVADKKEEDNIKAQNTGEFEISDGTEYEDLFKLNKDNESVINNNDLLSKIEKNEGTINVNVLRNRIIDSKEFITEIAQKSSAFLSKDKNEMNIQLKPENLGKISIKIGLNDGSLTGKIYAENYSVKEIIGANLNQLRNALEQNGLNISGLEVHIGNNSKNFDRNLFHSRQGQKQKIKGVPSISGSTFAVLDQDISDINPYLISGQFDGLI